MSLKAPFPWFGGKSRVAEIVWDRFGNVPNSTTLAEIFRKWEEAKEHK